MSNSNTRAEKNIAIGLKSLKTSNSDILTRFGFGITKVINENLQIISSIDYTDRGEAEWKEADGDILDLHIKSTNAVIKLRYYFK